jgi:hypothetical protein
MRDCHEWPRVFKNGGSVEAPSSALLRFYRLNQLAIVEKAPEREANFLALVIFVNLSLLLFLVGSPLVILLYGCEVAVREFAEIEIARRVVLVFQSVL